MRSNSLEDFVITKMRAAGMAHDMSDQIRWQRALKLSAGDVYRAYLLYNANSTPVYQREGIAHCVNQTEIELRELLAETAGWKRVVSNEGLSIYCKNNTFLDFRGASIAEIRFALKRHESPKTSEGLWQPSRKEFNKLHHGK